MLVLLAREAMFHVKHSLSGRRARECITGIETVHPGEWSCRAGCFTGD